MSMATAVNEYDGVVAAIEHYVKGAKSGSSEEMKRGFHEQATIFGYLGPDLIAGPIQLLYEWLDSNPPAADLQLRIASVDVTGEVAAVRLEMDNWGGHRFTDYFTLLKTDGKWNITNKVFCLHG